MKFMKILIGKKSVMRLLKCCAIPNIWTLRLFLKFYTFVNLFKHEITTRKCPSDTYQMKKVEESIDRLGGAKFITMLDLAPWDTHW